MCDSIHWLHRCQDPNLSVMVGCKWLRWCVPTPTPPSFHTLLHTLELLSCPLVITAKTPSSGAHHARAPGCLLTIPQGFPLDLRSHKHPCLLISQTFSHLFQRDGLCIGEQATKIKILKAVSEKTQRPTTDFSSQTVEARRQ